MLRSRMVTELQELLNASATFSDWTELTLLGYLAEGQDKFCEETGYFRDTSSLSITLQTNIAVYDVPDRIIEVLNIWDGTRKLRKLPFGEENNYFNYTPGKPFAWRMDEDTGVIKLYPTPSVAENGLVYPLQVWRYSLIDLASEVTPEGGGDPTDAVPELPSRFQRACIEWAAYKAFNHHDAETQDPVKAVDHLKAFQMYVKDGIRAMRHMHGIETRVGFDPAMRTNTTYWDEL